MLTHSLLASEILWPTWQQLIKQNRLCCLPSSPGHQIDQENQYQLWMAGKLRHLAATITAAK